MIADLSPTYLTYAQVLEILRTDVEENYPNHADAALDMDVGLPYLNDVLKGARLPSPAILDHLGMRAERVYRELDISGIDEGPVP